MNHYNQNQPQAQVAYPAPSSAYSAAAVEGPYVIPPPMGYPMKEDQGNSQNYPPSWKTQTRGDGFWKGCCAALCCCCVLDACF
ncbi:protein CYSTEINE-RICH TRANSMEMBRANE MODULE 6-like [Actinidia eriantha]|uniref:protein CYSTEINE-RICH TRANSMEMBRANE MODULE 6-like n=1 Tax=Actinidia eriantha TaxID=165200 RepID=UPI0025826F10|nr:protein CYSTEINE-RICH TRANSMEMBRANE MODULE 6-like [Actinidia eriantha]